MRATREGVCHCCISREARTPSRTDTCTYTHGVLVGMMRAPPITDVLLCSLGHVVISFLSRNLPLSSAILRPRVRPPPSIHTRHAYIVECSWCSATTYTARKRLRIHEPFSEIMCTGQHHCMSTKAVLDLFMLQTSS